MNDPHVLAAREFYIPPTMHVGHMSVIAIDEREPIALVNLFGVSDWPAGFYLLGGDADRMHQPLAGPFESEIIARSRIDRIGSDGYGYLDPHAVVFDPACMVKRSRVMLHAGARVDSFVKIEGGDGVLIGADVHVASFCHLNIGGGSLVMEAGSSVASGARILSGSALLGYESCSATHPRVHNVKTATIIGKGATVFTNATVSPGCILGERSALGGGSFLRPHTTIPPGELWAGVPAVFKKRITPLDGGAQ